MKITHSTAWMLVLTLIGVSITFKTNGALVGAAGYTNDFSVQPPTTDWSSYAIPGANSLIASAADMDTQVANLTAATINLQAAADAGNPPAASGTSASWSSSGLYLATRPTGDGATVHMCT